MIGLWRDGRLGGSPRWRLGDRRDLMRVPDELIECVAFTQATNGTKVCVGTVFFLAVDVETRTLPKRRLAYAVTAKHCLYPKGDDPSVTAELADTVELFMNLKAGGIGSFETIGADWVLHPVADVAVLPILDPLSQFSYRALTSNSLATPAFLAERRIGPGDDVFISGLLVHHWETDRIMPIARMGNIAALPQDPINLETGPDVAALVEVRSIGGLSGSPVFVHLPFWRDVPEGMTLVGGGAEADSGGASWLLGVMHGFFPVGSNDPDGVSQGREDLNTGIAVVSYADRILDIINDGDQITMRRKLAESWDSHATPVPTSGGVAPANLIPEEFSKFQELAQRLVRVPKSEIDDLRSGPEKPV